MDMSNESIKMIITVVGIVCVVVGMAINNWKLSVGGLTAALLSLGLL